MAQLSLVACPHRAPREISTLLHGPHGTRSLHWLGTHTPSKAEEKHQPLSGVPQDTAWPRGSRMCCRDGRHGSPAWFGAGGW